MAAVLRPDHRPVLQLVEDVLRHIRQELAEDHPALATLDADAFALGLFRNRIERDWPGANAAAAADALRTCAASVHLYTTQPDGPAGSRWQQALESVRQAYDRLLHWAREQEVRS